MQSRVSSLLTLLICCVFAPSIVWADEPTATIDGTGTASVRLVPEKLRMQVQIVVHGKTAELAVERLKARRDALADKLAALGAERKSAHFGDSSVNRLSPPDVQSYPVLPNYLIPQGGLTPYPAPTYYTPPTGYAPSTSGYSASVSAVPLTPVPVTIPPSAGDGPMPTVVPYSAPESAVPAPVVQIAGPTLNTYSPATPQKTVSSHPRATQQEFYLATATLTIDWPLHVETVEKAMLAGDALRKKIDASGNLLGGKAAESLPADEQELLEELSPLVGNATYQITRPVIETGPNGAQVMRMVSEEHVRPSNGQAGIPAAVMQATYLYVAVISNKQRKALLAEAFGKAKAHAAELAEASGGRLGAIRKLAGEINETSGEISGPGFAYPSPNPSPDHSEMNGERSTEAINACPRSLLSNAVVQATFKLD